MPEIFVGIIYIVMEIESGKLFQGGRTGRVSPREPELVIIIVFVVTFIAPLVICCDVISLRFRCLHIRRTILRTLGFWVLLFFKYAAPRTVIVVIVIIDAQYFTID